MKARWWHLRGKASVKGEQVAQGSSVRACNLPCVWPTALFGWHLVLWCPVCLVTEHTALFSNFSHDYAVTKSNVLMPPRKRRIAGICWSDAPSEYVQKPKPTCGEMDHASFERPVGVRACGWGAALRPSMWRWSSGRQWGQAPSQAGFGGPVGCPIVNVASLGEVLEHSLEPSPPPSQMVGFGSRNEKKVL